MSVKVKSKRSWKLFLAYSVCVDGIACKGLYISGCFRKS